MTREELIDVVGRDILRAYPWASDLGYVAHVAIEIVDHGYATVSGDEVTYHNDARRKWPCVPAAKPLPPPLPPAAPIETPPDLETELAAITGNDDKSKCKRAAIRAAHIQRSNERQ